jgi:hypothetical protein
MANASDDMQLYLDYFDTCLPATEYVVLPRANPFEDYSEKKFRERFRLSKAAVAKLLPQVCIDYS